MRFGAEQRRALGEIADQPDHVIGHCGDRQTLDRLLQAKLQPGAVVHRGEQVAVLLLDLDVDPGAQQCRRPRQLARQIGLPFLDRAASAHGRRDAALQEAGPGVVARHDLLGERVQPFLDDAVIGAAGAESVEAGRCVGLELGGELGQFGEQRLAVALFGRAHPAGQLGQSVLDAAQTRRQRLRQRQAEHAQRAVGLDLDQPLGERAGAGGRHAEVEDEDLGQPVAILPEVGDDRRLAVLDDANSKGSPDRSRRSASRSAASICGFPGRCRKSRCPAG